MKRNKNNGFTLVELIVVIVILAILVGVTIGGIYSYVNKARINTDINNASSIQSVVSTLATDPNIIGHEGTFTAAWNYNAPWVSYWNKLAPSCATSGDFKVGDQENYIQKKIGELFTDGLPASKTGGRFTLTIKTEGTGSNAKVTVTCVINGSDGNPLVAAN
jgi:prepilin-type N-terminal cleavage/methylation domain-containing protein